MNWRSVQKTPPREGQIVLGYDKDIKQVSIYVYRKGVFHVRGEEHFTSGGLTTLWMPLPEPK